MPNATVLNAWKDANTAHLAVTVTEAGGKVEYIGHVPLVDLQGLSPAEQKAALVAAVKAVRDAQQGAAPATLAGISGTVVV